MFTTNINMNIFSFFKLKNKTDWSILKRSGEIYPQKFTLLIVENQQGELTNGWIDFGYVNYKYKNYCPYFVQCSVELEDIFISSGAEIIKIENYIVNMLKEICVVHPVAQMHYDNKLVINLYVDNCDYVSQVLAEAHKNQMNLKFEFKVSFDEEWKEYDLILTQIKTLP